MLMRFYSTYDTTYASRVYPYMLECANFWEDYLKLEDGRYVIYMDHFNEVMPRLGSTGNWRDRLGDFNSTLSLGLVKMLFKGMIDMSTYLGKDKNRQEKWTHILTHLSKFPVGEADGRPSLQSVEKRPWGNERPAGLNRVSIHGLLMPAGGGGIETLAAVPLTINEMLLQSYEGVLRIFPNWNPAKDAQFDQLRAYGAFLVSSRLQKGQVDYLRLFSEKGRPCILEDPWPGKNIQLTRNGKKAEILSGHTVQFNTVVKELIGLKRI